MVEGLVPSEAPAVKCSYCGIITEDKDKDEMGFETDYWAICSNCFKKACDKAGGK